MKRGDPIPKYLDSLVSIELFGEIPSTIQLRVFHSCQNLWRVILFSTFQAFNFHIDLRRVFLSVSGAPGSRAQLLCRLVRKFKRLLSDNFCDRPDND
jgi:hypothetical protein